MRCELYIATLLSVCLHNANSGLSFPCYFTLGKR